MIIGARARHRSRTKEKTPVNVDFLPQQASTGTAHFIANIR